MIVDQKLISGTFRRLSSLAFEGFSIAEVAFNEMDARVLKGLLGNESNFKN
jgi:hypothetical protein